MINLYEPVKCKKEFKKHPKFLLLKNEIQLHSEKRMLNNWTDGFIDKDNKFVREFQETFHSSFWELYLYRLFTSGNFELDQTHQVPDFIIKKPKEVYVEAVVANISNAGRKESERTVEDQLSMTIPPYMQEDYKQFLDEAIIRSASAINFKKDKWVKEYRNKFWVNSDTPFLIALSSYDQVNYGREYIYSMLALLYGLYFDSESEGFIEKEFVEKGDKKVKIPIGLFNNDEYKDISAVIFSCTITLGKLTSLAVSEGNTSLNMVYNIRKNCEINRYVLQIVDEESKEDIADGVFIFHNPNANNPLPEDFFSELAVTQFFYEEKNINYTGNATPIVARINAPIVFKSCIEPLIMENLRAYNKLEMNEFYDFIQENR